MRKAIALSTITLSVKQYVDDGGVTHIDIEQTATGGIKTTELRTLDWQVRDHEDRVFGKVDAQARWVKLADVDDDDFLKSGWDDLEGEHVQGYVKSKTNGWTADQVCMLFFSLHREISAPSPQASGKGKSSFTTGLFLHFFSPSGLTKPLLFIIIRPGASSMCTRRGTTSDTSSSAKTTIGNKPGSFMIILGNEFCPPESNQFSGGPGGGGGQNTK